MAEAGSVEARDGRLPASLAAVLDAKLRDALDHPVRRGVLRVLGRRERALGLGELVAELEPYGASQVSYHLQVLCNAGVVASKQGYFGPGKGHAQYASVVGGDAQVLSVLRAVEVEDRELREATKPERRSPLTMFRIPRPGSPTIRLRSRSRTGSDR